MVRDTLDLDKPIKADKGQFNGSCNRQCCQAPGATWYNYGTMKYYCFDCAMLLNQHNPDFKRNHNGTPMVVPTQAAIDVLYGHLKERWLPHLFTKDILQ